MPWDGGQKVWHDSVLVLDQTNAHWRVAGKLPRPLGYGVSLTTKRGVLCVGGSDATRHYADAFLLTCERDQVAAHSLASLPVPLANAAGALVGQIAYVTGGSEQPGEQAAVNRFFALDLTAHTPAWQELPPCPGEARILPAAATASAFYLAGGARCVRTTARSNAFTSGTPGNLPREPGPGSASRICRDRPSPRLPPRP